MLENVYAFLTMMTNYWLRSFCPFLWTLTSSRSIKKGRRRTLSTASKSNWTVEILVLCGGRKAIKNIFHGRLASVNMWDKVLSESDIAAQYTNCSVPHGSVLNWSAFKNLTHGNVTVEEP